MPLAFDLQNSRDCLEDLRGAVSDFKKDPLNPRLARYSAILAWSICDWVFEEHGDRLGFNDLPSFQGDIKQRCPELDYLQDLANSLKHRTITRYTPSLTEAYQQEGAFSRAFSRGFDIPALMLTTQDGTQLWFDDVIEGTLSFWDVYFGGKGI